MAELQKKEFIGSLKRLKAFFNNLKQYDPDKKVLMVKDFIKIDMSQPDFHLLIQCPVKEDANEEKKQQ